MIYNLIHLIWQLLSMVFLALFEVFRLLFNLKSKRKEELDADFAPVSSVLGRNNKGFTLTGHRSLTVKQSYMSSLILGASGSGKTVSVVTPSIYNLAKHGHSMFINDPSGELKSATVGRLQQLGYEIHTVHYSKPKESDGYNILSRAKSDSDLQKAATLLVRNTLGSDPKDPFWSNQAIMLISLIAKLLRKDSFWFQTMANVKYLLDLMASKPEALDVLFAKHADREMLTEFKIFVAMDKKLLSSIISTCRSALMIFADKNVQKVTSYDSFDFESFRKQKSVLYIQNPTGDMKYYATLTAIFFEQLFSFLMEKFPAKEDKSVFIVIDEASSLYLPTLQIALSNLRKFRAGIMAVAQDYNQFVHLYGSYEAEAIKTNCWSKVYFPGQPLSTCQELERLLGVFEFQDQNGTRRTRHLMSADEVRTMEPNTSLIVTGSNRVIMARMKPFYKNMRLSPYSKIPVPETENKMPFEDLPIINVPNKV